jgi:hypothetical protein
MVCAAARPSKRAGAHNARGAAAVKAGGTVRGVRCVHAHEAGHPSLSALPYEVELPLALDGSARLLVPLGGSSRSGDPARRAAGPGEAALEEGPGPGAGPASRG